MTSGTEHDLIRLLAGELDPAEARGLEDRIRREPELAAAYHRLERTWRGLELPPTAPVPFGFTGRVMAKVRGQRNQLSWSAAPGWVRATAAAALVAGAALGVGVGRSLPVPESQPAAVSASASVSSPSEEDYSLAGSYWSLVEDATGSDNNSDNKEAQP
jgi:anti-sigma factor RsiW